MSVADISARLVALITGANPFTFSRNLLVSKSETTSEYKQVEIKGYINYSILPFPLSFLASCVSF